MEFSPPFLIVSVCILVLGVPLMIFRYRKGRGVATVKFSSLGSLRRIPPSLSHRLRHILPLLRLLALVLVLFAFSRPRRGDEYTQVSTKGIAIQMVVDRSSSMVASTLRYRGERLTRLEVVKEVFKLFVRGDGEELEGRKNDLVGLTTLDAFPEEECPLTLDHATLLSFVESMTPAPPVEDKTAIGDAIYRAVLSLIVADDYVREATGSDREYKIQSKIIILLTDGEHNYGDLDPVEAAEFARENNIKIYTIAITGEDEMERDFFGFLIPRMMRGFNTKDIEESAQITGGIFEEATDGESLKKIYEKIDRLEKSQFKQTFLRYHELYQWPVLAALACLWLEIFLSTTWFRKIP